MPDVSIGAELRVQGLAGFKASLRSAQARATKLKLGLKEMNRAGGRAFAKLGRGARSAADTLGSVAGGLLKVTGALGGVGALAVRQFGKFDLAMGRIQTLLPAGVSAMDQFGSTVLKNSTRYGQSVEIAADAVFQGISASMGSTQEEVESFSKVVGEAAAGGFTDMATVVDGLSTIINAYGLDVKEAEEVSDAFFVANRLGKTTFEELSASIGRVAPTAKSLGVSYEELLSATIAMTKSGINTAETMSALKAVLANVAKPSAAAKKGLEELADAGKYVDFSVSALKRRGLDGFLSDLVKATDGNAEAQVGLFKSIEAFNAISVLTSETGIKSFNEGLEAMEDRAGTAKKAFADAEGTIGFKLQQIRQGMSRFVLEIGAGLVEGLGLDKIENIPDAIERAAKTVRNSAKEFAEGFSEAFAPLQSTASFDWAGLAQTLGSAAGNLVNAFLKLAQIIAEVVSSQGFKDLMFVTGAVLGGTLGIGEGKSEGAIQAKHGGKGEAGVDVFRFGGPGLRSVRTGKHQFGEMDPAKVRAAAINSLLTQGVSGDFGSESGFVRGSTGELIRVGGGNIEGFIQAESAKLMGKELAARASWNSRKVAERSARNLADIGAFGERASSAVQDQLAKGKGFAGAIAKGAENAWNVTVHMVNKMNVKDKSAKKKKSFGARGRGDAVVRSSSEQMYLLTANGIVPMADEFHFAKLLNEVQS